MLVLDTVAKIPRDVCSRRYRILLFLESRSVGGRKLQNWRELYQLLQRQDENSRHNGIGWISA